jgi:predicted nucleotidyltransferase component of viral defense system
MLDHEEKAAIAAAFGVDETQVEHDHFISHVLLAIASLELPVTFFGGTALARTFLTSPAEGARLSEDIDLFTPNRREVATALDNELPQRLRREFPGTVWDPGLTRVRSQDPGQLLR